MSARFAKPYVDALFNVAGSASKVEELLPPLQGFADALLAAEDLKSVLRNPAVDREAKVALLRAVAGRAGVTGLGERLLQILLQNHRLVHLPDLLAAMRERLDRERRVLEGTLRTAEAVDETAVETIRAALERGGRRRLRLRTFVDPSLIGGFVVTLGSEVYDASLVRRLERARLTLHATPSAAGAGREGRT